MAPPKSPEHIALGTALRSYRSERGWTLEQMADEVPGGMNPRYISACERGEINLSFGNLLRICQALGVPLSQVVLRYEQRF